MKFKHEALFSDLLQRLDEIKHLITATHELVDTEKHTESSHLKTQFRLDGIERLVDGVAVKVGQIQQQINSDNTLPHGGNRGAGFTNGNHTEIVENATQS